MSDKVEFKSAEEANEFKNTLCREVITLMQDKTAHLEGRARWLVWGRVVNALMSQHFGLSYAAAIKILDEKEKV
jgi:hypothetical protein